MLDISFKNLAGQPGYTKKYFQRIFETSVKLLEIDNVKLGLSLSLVGNDEMRKLNKKYRKLDKVTDVLSFPLHKAPLSEKTTVGDIIELGDIFLAPDYIKGQAKIRGLSHEKELTMLAAHAFLHLLGFDHEISPIQSKKMFNAQDKILKALV